jgi:hypothetical protein
MSLMKVTLVMTTHIQAMKYFLDLLVEFLRVVGNYRQLFVKLSSFPGEE